MRAAAAVEPAWQTRVTMQRKRRCFGRHCSFSDEAAEQCAPSGAPDTELAPPEPVVHRVRIDAATQVSAGGGCSPAKICCLDIAKASTASALPRQWANLQATGVGEQGAPVLLDAAVQATSEPPRRNCSEYEPRELSADDRDAIMASPGFTDFLARIRPRCTNPLR